MNNIYFYSLWKHPLLWFTFPIWLLLGILSALMKEQAGLHRRH
ncbi:MAG: hypothetical protein WBL80_03250 [Erysipelotrichaceae bacterium]